MWFKNDIILPLSSSIKVSSYLDNPPVDQTRINQYRLHMGLRFFEKTNIQVSQIRAVWYDIIRQTFL